MKKLLILVACLFSVSLLAQNQNSQTKQPTAKKAATEVCKWFNYTTLDNNQNYKVTVCTTPKTPQPATTTCVKEETKEFNFYTFVWETIVRIYNSPSCESPFKPIDSK